MRRTKQPMLFGKEILAQARLAKKPKTTPAPQGNKMARTKSRQLTFKFKEPIPPRQKHPWLLNYFLAKTPFEKKLAEQKMLFNGATNLEKLVREMGYKDLRDATTKTKFEITANLLRALAIAREIYWIKEKSKEHASLLAKKRRGRYLSPTMYRNLNELPQIIENSRKRIMRFFPEQIQAEKILKSKASAIEEFRELLTNEINAITKTPEQLQKFGILCANQPKNPNNPFDKERIQVYALAEARVQRLRSEW